jgi:hypothetical protein
MREDRLDDLLGVSLVAEDRCPVLRVLVERRMDLVVEVVEEGGHAPQLLVLAEPARIAANGRLDGQRVPQERLALGVARERVPGLLAGRRHGSLGYRPCRSQSQAA